MRVSALRAHAYAELGITEEDVVRGPQITDQLRAIAAQLQRAGQPTVKRRVMTESGDVTTREIIDTRFRAPYGPGTDLPASWPTFLSQSDSPDARAVLEMYSRIPKTERRYLPVEAFCLAAKISPVRVMSLITEVLVRSNAQASVIIGAVNQPRIVQKLVDRALDDYDDTRMESATLLSKASGFLPAPKGSQTNIQVNTQANANASSQAATVVAPPPEQAIRRLTDRFNAVRGLPAAAPPVLEPVREAIPATATAVRESQPVEFDEEDDDVFSRQD